MKSIISTITLILAIPLWVTLAIFESTTYFLVHPKPVTFRAWETAYNADSLDAYITPFKPQYKYDGILRGDSSGPLHFKPKPSEIRHQIFITDEYGFRNSPGFIKKGIDAVIFGNSYVAGADETQEELVSTILTNEYNIRTYNHGSLPLQRFWENELFQKTPPKYVIVLGTEKEIRESNWIETLTDNGVTYTPIAWNSQEEWENHNLPNRNISWKKITNFNYELVTSKIKYNSMTRFLVNKLHTEIMNLLFTRPQLAVIYAKNNLQYDTQTDIIFFQVDQDDPTLTEKVKHDIGEAMQTLTSTKNLLATRGITLIIVAVPTKGHLYYQQYQKIPYNEHSLILLEEQLQKNNIIHIKLHDLLHYMANTQTELLYYADDSHWSAYTNRIISKLLAEKIYQLQNYN